LKYYVGVDIGATNLRVAVADEKMRILERLTEKTSRDNLYAISQQMVRIIRSFRVFRSGVVGVGGIGVGAAGPLSMKRGVLLNPCILDAAPIPVVKPLEEEFGVRVKFLNDCNAAVLGEAKFGAGLGISNLVYVTLSTGIGGGAYVDGHLLLGKDGNAVEIGHMVIDSSGRLMCRCGMKGHWEAYCSGTKIPEFARALVEDGYIKLRKNSALMRRSGGDLNHLNTKMIYNAAKDRDAMSLEILRRVNDYNAIGFGNIMSIYDPELITVGGAVTLANPELVLGPMKKKAGKYTVNRPSKIMLTPLKENIVLYGAIGAAYNGIC
jgi:glucokinase